MGLLTHLSTGILTQLGLFQSLSLQAGDQYSGAVSPFSFVNRLVQRPFGRHRSGLSGNEWLVMQHELKESTVCVHGCHAYGKSGCANCAVPSG